MVPAAPVAAVAPPVEGTQLITAGPEGPDGNGDTDTIVVPVPDGTNLGDIVSISWDEYLVAGYAPHVDIMLDMSAITAIATTRMLINLFIIHLPLRRKGDSFTYPPCLKLLLCRGCKD